MMGQLPPDQSELFYEFCLENHVPKDHLLRRINAVLDLSGLREYLTPCYSHTGRPSVDPELMIRILIVGYCYGIRSERRLCDEVHLNLAYRWFCRLGLEGAVPDHSTFSTNRHGRFRDNETFRWVFDQVVQSAIAAGLVKGEGFAVDASTVEADANPQRGTADAQSVDWHDPKLISRAVDEYLAALEDAEVPLMESPKKVSLTDPLAQWSAASGAPARFSYSTNYLVDTRCGIILDVAATPAYRPAEVECTKAMIEHVEARFELTPEHLIGDTAYGTAPMLGWLVDEKGIAPHVPVWEKGERKDGTFSRGDFQWDEAANEYRRPVGKTLRNRRRKLKHPRTNITKDNTIIYRASQHDCRDCALKERCCPNDSHRKIRRSIHEAARDVARGLARTAAYRRSSAQRKKVEMLFAHLKRILKLDRLRLRGLTGANDEFILAATAQNLRRLATLTAQGPPDHRMRTPA